MSIMVFYFVGTFFALFALYVRIVHILIYRRKNPNQRRIRLGFPSILLYVI